MTQPAGSLSYMPHVDGLRAIAVGLVLVCHYGLLWDVAPLRWLGFHLGGLGVELFFVLSGYLITRILLGARARIVAREASLSSILSAFYARRALRIFPAYVLLVATLAAAGSPALRAHWLSVVTYTFNYDLAWHPGNALPIAHFWSLAVEEQFYLVWPTLVLLLPRRYALALTLLAIAQAEGWRLWTYSAGGGPFAIRFPTSSCLDSLGWGALLAQLRALEAARVERWVARVGVVVGVPALLLLARAPHPNLPFWVHAPLFSGPLAFACVARCSAGPRSRLGALLARGAPVYLGRISYGIYLYHLPVQHYLVPCLPGGEELPRAVQFLICAPATVAVASLSFSLLERPLSRLKRRWPMRGRPPRPG